MLKFSTIILQNILIKILIMFFFLKEDKINIVINIINFNKKKRN